MEIYVPGYYHSFRCIADACPDSCCKEWAVDVDPQTATYYRGLSGALADRLRSVLQDTDDGTVMEIENGRCPMWRRDGLCEIQAQLGHDALCKTCRDFPRIRHDYGNFVEMGLELSCPEAARLILTSPDHQLFPTTGVGGEAPEYDPEIMTILRDTRSEALSFLDRSTYAIPETLAILLLHSHNVQAQLDGGEAIPLDPKACLKQARRYAQIPNTAAFFSFFQQLEILTTQWRARLMGTPVTIAWSPALLALARYGIQRYWLQAISDYDIVCRVKFVLSACLLVGSLGGDPIQTAQLFSKEIENDPDNMELILSGAYTSPAFTDTNLLGLLLNKNQL